MRLKLAALIIGTSVLAGCAGLTGPAPAGLEAGPTPSAEEPAAPPDSLAPPRRSAEPYPTPTAGAESSPLPDGRYVVYASSPPAEMGVPYAFKLYTHCGLDFIIDFDESLWDLIAPPEDRDGFEDPFDEGTMTLIAENEASYVSSHGVEIRYSRRSEPEEIHPCM